MISLRFKNGKIIRKVIYDKDWNITTYPLGDKLILTRNIMKGSLITSFIVLENNKVIHYYLKDGNPESIKIVRNHLITLGNPISGYLELYNTDDIDENISFNFRDEKTQSAMEFLLIDSIERRNPNGSFKNSENINFITDGVKISTSDVVNISDATYVIIKTVSPTTTKLICKENPYKMMRTFIDNMGNNKYPLVV